jgi:hypothetical protein
MKILFLPFSIAGGFLAGLIGKKLFEAAWGVVDEEEPPDAEHRDIDYVKLGIALALEGAIFRVVRGLLDHAARRQFMRLTGAWPGEERPEPE